MVRPEVTVYLKSAYIGKGLGSMAIKYIEEYAKKTKVTRTCGYYMRTK